MYDVHMKRVTASEARRNWFRLLDEVVAGATVVVERAGARILIRRDDEDAPREDLPDYASILRAPRVAEADRWGWEWREEDGDLVPTEEG